MSEHARAETKEELPTPQRQEQDRRQLARFDLSARIDTAVLMTAIPVEMSQRSVVAGIRNISTGGLCVEFPAGEALSELFELKLFFPQHIFPDQRRPIDAIATLMWKGQGSRPRVERVGLAVSVVNERDQKAMDPSMWEGRPGQAAKEVRSEVHRNGTRVDRSC